MPFYGAFVNMQLGRYLLVQLASKQMRQDFVVTRRESAEPAAQFAELGSLPVFQFIPCQRSLHCGNQFLPRSAFSQEILRAMPHGVDAGRYVTLTREKNDGQRILGFGEGFL